MHVVGIMSTTDLVRGWRIATRTADTELIAGDAVSVLTRRGGEQAVREILTNHASHMEEHVPSNGHR